MPYIKNNIRVKVPQRSGFDKSHRCTGTSFCGTLTPILVDELVPNTRVSLRVPIAVQMPPLASDTFMNVKYKVEAFFVPMRLLCKSFEDFFCDFPKRVLTTSASTTATSGATFTDVKGRIPVFQIKQGVGSGVYSPGSLLDYLGFKANIPNGASYNINPLSLVAYHLVWQEYYRNPRAQNPAFAEFLGPSALTAAGLPSQQRVPSMPYNFYHDDFVGPSGTTVPANYLHVVDSATLPNFVCADGVSLFDLRQRNFGLDYFTGARVAPQLGSPSEVDIYIPSGTDSAGGVTSVTIAQIRAANSLQQFRERNGLPSPRLVDQVKARYNANLSDGVAQRPICIGSASFDVVSRGVDQTSDNPSPSTTNPFNNVGNQYGRAAAAGNSFVIEDFVANEPGFLLVLGSLVPEVTYSSGVLPHFKRYQAAGSITDMACSLLQNVGDQAIFDDELIDAVGGGPARVFAYTDRYADFMFHPNECHGQMRDGQTLASFVLQRSFLNRPTYGTQFLEIPKDYLDAVMATTSALSSLTYWYDAYLQYKVSMPLAEYSIPSLQDPAYEHGDTVNIRRNGQIF